jgi:Phosphotransferase enzyme family
MAVSPTAATAGGEETALRDLLREALPRAGAAADALLEVERAVLPSTTSYTTAAVTARLRGGGTVRIFLKDFGHSRLPKDGAAARRRREIHVYRDLLDGSEAGTPEYYGSLEDEAAGRVWLLLELVEGVQLRECELDAWIAAAGWLARLHARFAGRAAELERSPLLIRHDEDYFRSKAVEARRTMRSFQGRASRRTAALLDGYDELAAAMARGPRTLVHGNYRAKNVVVQRSARRTRVVPVDWEVAAVGSPLYDLGHLLDGFRGDALRALLEAYRSEAQALGVPAPGDEETMRLMRAFCLHRVVKSLARAVEKGFGERDVGGLLDHGEGLREEIAR